MLKLMATCKQHIPVIINVNDVVEMWGKPVMYLGLPLIIHKIRYVVSFTAVLSRYDYCSLTWNYVTVSLSRYDISAFSRSLRLLATCIARSL